MMLGFLSLASCLWLLVSGKGKGAWCFSRDRKPKSPNVTTTVTQQRWRNSSCLIKKQPNLQVTGDLKEVVTRIGCNFN